MEEWMACQGEWSKSTLYERMTASKSVRKRGARTWLTKQQIATKYGDMSIAEEIVQAKLADETLRETQTKPHPDAPNSKVGFFFWIDHLKKTIRYGFGSSLNLVTR